MSLARLLNQPLVLHKNTLTVKDAYGNVVPSDATTTNIVGFIEQSESVETMNDRDVSVTSWTAHLPAGTNVNAQDRIGYGSQLFEVDGEPWIVYNPRTRSESHIVAKLKVVS